MSDSRHGGGASDPGIASVLFVSGEGGVLDLFVRVLERTGGVPGFDSRVRSRLLLIGGVRGRLRLGGAGIGRGLVCMCGAMIAPWRSPLPAEQAVLAGVV